MGFNISRSDRSYETAGEAKNKAQVKLEQLLRRRGIFLFISVTLFSVACIPIIRENLIGGVLPQGYFYWALGTSIISGLFFFLAISSTLTEASLQNKITIADSILKNLEQELF